MVYISRFNGKSIDDYQDTVESLITIYSTPRRTRPYLRGWGSDLFLRQDATATESLKLDLYRDLADASKLEPRFKLEKVSINLDNSVNGEVYADVYGVYLPTNKFIVLEGLKVL